jgi:hypothetical protein
MLCCSFIPTQVRQNFMYTEPGFCVVFAGDQADVQEEEETRPLHDPREKQRTTDDAALLTMRKCAKKTNFLDIDLNSSPYLQATRLNRKRRRRSPCVIPKSATVDGRCCRCSIPAQEHQEDTACGGDVR